MIKIAIVGYGNLGRGVQAALEKSADMELAAFFSRRPDAVKKAITTVPVLDSEVDRPPQGLDIDVAILCGGSKDDTPRQGPRFARWYNTVDSFDTHAEIPGYFGRVEAAARAGGHVSVISAGWDPGLFSLERVLGDAFLPGSGNYTFWGPGVSQGHSDAARRIEGVLDARQYTLPVKEALEQVRGGAAPKFTRRQMHKRLVYVVAKEGADRERIRREIAAMPNYYDEYDTEVRFISTDEMARRHSAFPHGGFVLTTGKTGGGHREILEYSCKLESNPEFTGSVLAACARAAFRLHAGGSRGAFTMLDIPPALYSPRPPEELRGHFI